MISTSIVSRALIRVAAILALVGMSSAPPVSGQIQPGIVEGLAVGGGEASTILSVKTDRQLEWSAIWLSSSVLWLTFPNSIPGDDVANLSLDGGLIASIGVLSSQDEDLTATLLEVFLRRPASYSTAIGERQIAFTFTPRGERPSAAPGTAGTSSADPQPATPALPEISGEYRIGPGDLIELSIFGLDDFDRTVRVLRDGAISLPLLGGIRVAGMTLEEAEGTIAGLLSERQLVNDPQVSLFVKDYVSRGVSVQGAVEKPGVYQMIQQRSLLEILGEAGGLSGRENERAGQAIFVIRETADGQQTRIEIDSEQLVNQGRADLNIALFPGDVILVPFVQKQRVYVSGAVVRPGPVEYLSSEGITVLQAITAAGGTTERGNLGNVAILRRLADGSETRTVINVKKIRKGKQQDVRLERNDTVLVGEWFF